MNEKEACVFALESRAWPHQRQRPRVTMENIDSEPLHYTGTLRRDRTMTVWRRHHPRPNATGITKWIASRPLRRNM
jgi:hypothetical protein